MCPASWAVACIPRSAANLADLVRVMNCYYSNLIEGHNTTPREIERALDNQLDQEEERRNLQLESTGTYPFATGHRPASR